MQALQDALVTPAIPPTPPTHRNFKRVLLSQVALLALVGYLLGNDWATVKPSQAKGVSTTKKKERLGTSFNVRPSLQNKYQKRGNHSSAQELFRPIGEGTKRQSFNSTKTLDIHLRPSKSKQKRKRTFDLRDAKRTSTNTFVQANNYIYLPGWDSAPIVLESHRLVFFAIPKVGCTVFKQLFRRIMGYKDWNVHGGPGLPHNPQRNGLKYLYHYNLEKASEIMTSPDWTRAVFVRNPQDRVLSAFLDKAIYNDGAYLKHHCCRTCNVKTLDKFLDLISKKCMDAHWLPQWLRMEKKYWPFIDFVGNFDNVHDDTKRLLQQLGLWEKYGSTGWGKDGTDEIFGETKTKHYTGADQLHSKYYTPRLEQRVRSIYRMEYENDVFSHFFLDSNHMQAE